jgi:Flp pilus assembly protein TadD
MLIRSKRHWATLLAVGLPLVVGGCAGGMGTHGAQKAPEANASHMDALSLADRLKAEGNFSSAASMYQQAAQANPGDVRPLVGMGDSFLAIGSNADAAQAYSAALALQPNNLEALRGLGHVRILLGQPQFAVTQYQTALKIAPNDIRILNGLGVAQDMVGDHAAAQKSYHRVLTLDPGNQSAKNNLALSMALAGDDAGAIKILEDVSKSSTATAVNRQNLALLYGVSGQMAQAEQVSRADLPPDVVNRNMAAMSASGGDARKQELLKQSLGVELKGRQYAPAAQPVTPLTNLAQTSSIEGEPVYMSSHEGADLPVITTGQTATTGTAQSTDVVVRTSGKKDAWSDWDEELVDATDVNGATGTQTATAPAQSTTSNITEADDSSASAAASQDAGAPRFLSSTNAIADDKPATSATTPASAPAAPSKPAASSSATATQMVAVPPTTTTAAVEKPASASAMPAATPTAAAEKPTASAATTSAAAATAGADTAAATTMASLSSGGSDPASSMTVTAKTMDAAKVYTVQIASYRSEQEASTGWQTLTAEQADLLAKLPHAVAKADLGADKGIYYRLQAGSFSDRNDAKALCSDLKDRSIDCMVVEAAPTAAAPASTQQSMLAPGDSFLIGAR